MRLPPSPAFSLGPARPPSAVLGVASEGVGEPSRAARPPSPPTPPPPPRACPGLWRLRCLEEFLPPPAPVGRGRRPSSSSSSGGSRRRRAAAVAKAAATGDELQREDGAVQLFAARSLPSSLPLCPPLTGSSSRAEDRGCWCCFHHCLHHHHHRHLCRQGKYAPAPDNRISCFQDKDRSPHRFPPSSPPFSALPGPWPGAAARGGNNGEVSGEFWLRPGCVGAAPSPCRIAVRRK